MSAPRKIWAYSMDAEEDRHGGWDVYQDDGYDAPQSLYHHDDVVRELVEENARLSQQVESLALSVGEWRSLAMFYVVDDPMYSSGNALAKIAQEG